MGINLFDHAFKIRAVNVQKTMIRKRRDQKEITTPKTEVGKRKLTIRYIYLENVSRVNKNRTEIL